MCAPGNCSRTDWAGPTSVGLAPFTLGVVAPVLARPDDITYDTTMTRRVVLDTNVLVSALRSQRGASHAVLRRVGTGQFEICLSVALLLEYESVLKRPSIGITLSRATVDDILDYLAKVGQPQDIHFLWRPTLPDAADDHVLELAVAGGCDTIITFNRRDFRGAERFGVEIASPATFLLDLRSEES